MRMISPFIPKQHTLTRKQYHSFVQGIWGKYGFHRNPFIGRVSFVHRDFTMNAPSERNVQVWNIQNWYRFIFTNDFHTTILSPLIQKQLLSILGRAGQVDHSLRKNGSPDQGFILRQSIFSLLASSGEKIHLDRTPTSVRNQLLVQAKSNHLYEFDNRTDWTSRYYQNQKHTFPSNAEQKGQISIQQYARMIEQRFSDDLVLDAMQMIIRDSFNLPLLGRRWSTGRSDMSGESLSNVDYALDTIVHHRQSAKESDASPDRARAYKRF